MKKQDILTYLGNEFYDYNDVKEKRTDGDITWYQAIIFDKNPDTSELSRRAINFYVKAEDTSDEEAFYDGNKPTSRFNQTTTTTFRDNVNQYIVDKVRDDVIEEGTIERINSDAETCVVLATIDDGSGNLVTEKFLVNKDSDGNLQHTQIN